MRQRNRNVVYSTADDDFVEKKPAAKSSKTSSRSLAPAEQTIGILRDKKGRGGKQVTVLRDFQLTAVDLETLGKQLKKACGSGGTVKDGGVIEIQGDHRDKLAALLQKQGFKTKFIGG